MSDRVAFRVAEVAAAVGVQPDTVVRWIHSNELPAVKIGHTWLVLASDFQRLLGGTE